MRLLFCGNTCAISINRLRSNLSTGQLDDGTRCPFGVRMNFQEISIPPAIAVRNLQTRMRKIESLIFRATT